ncbi:MAG: phosphonoacetaldehyde hydrolase [Coriobacteriales bacterium]|jgi:phosphonoacetaldehyde hydrolase|nr:phosphonoacetaldehyde hydrolase [Coriobacteriales bacterium]
MFKMQKMQMSDARAEKGRDVQAYSSDSQVVEKRIARAEKGRDVQAYSSDSQVVEKRIARAQMLEGSNSAKISCVVLDWAGTTVDFGCFAPLDAFIAAFKAFGITPTIEETRAPMGLSKRDHIKSMLNEERISRLWQEEYGQSFTGEDIERIYKAFEPMLFSTLEKNDAIIPEVLDAVAKLRQMGIRIGSTTGYSKAMMVIVAHVAKMGGYTPDCLVCPDDTNGIGRPFPFMLWRNLEALGVASINNVIKVGDTVADIAEGKNAGCISVGVIRGSSMLGLSLLQYESKSSAQIVSLHDAARHKFLGAGADFVLEDIGELPGLVRQLNEERK